MFAATPVGGGDGGWGANDGPPASGRLSNDISTVLVMPPRSQPAADEGAVSSWLAASADARCPDHPPVVERSFDEAVLVRDCELPAILHSQSRERRVLWPAASPPGGLVAPALLSGWPVLRARSTSTLNMPPGLTGRSVVVTAAAAASFARPFDAGALPQPVRFSDAVASLVLVDVLAVVVVALSSELQRLDKGLGSAGALPARSVIVKAAAMRDLRPGGGGVLGLLGERLVRRRHRSSRRLIGGTQAQTKPVVISRVLQSSQPLPPARTVSRGGLIGKGSRRGGIYLFALAGQKKKVLTLVLVGW